MNDTTLETARKNWEELKAHFSSISQVAGRILCNSRVLSIGLGDIAVVMFPSTADRDALYASARLRDAVLEHWEKVAGPDAPLIGAADIDSVVVITRQTPSVVDYDYDPLE